MPLKNKFPVKTNDLFDSFFLHFFGIVYLSWTFNQFVRTWKSKVIENEKRDMIAIFNLLQGERMQVFYEKKNCERLQCCRMFERREIQDA